MQIIPGGNATKPQGEGPKLIIHIVNDQGGWGAGFVVALSRCWTEPEQEYRAMRPQGYQLGTIQVVPVGDKLSVVNMVAQHGTGGTPKNPPIRLDALRECLGRVAQEAMRTKASVHMPPIGCGLAGGSWGDIGPIVKEELVDKGIEVTVYDRDNILAEDT